MLTHKEMSSKGGKNAWKNKSDEEISQILSDRAKKMHKRLGHKIKPKKALVQTAQ